MSLPDEAPNLARMYDYYLGGATNTAVDREAAERGLLVTPHARTFALANRAFLRRAVRYLLEAGVDQFLDLGSGIPTVGNVHEIVRAADPGARVAYVDIDPVAVACAEDLLGETAGVTVTRADVRDVDGVLSARGVSGLLDFSRPVAVLAVAVLHAIPDRDDPAGVIAAYRAACAPGSHLAATHLSPTSLTDEQQAGARAVLDATPTPVTMRSRDEIAAMLARYDLVDPGLVLLPDWRPDDDRRTSAQARDANAYAAVGVASPAPVTPGPR